MRGSTGRQRVPNSVFRDELRIPLPPLDEQRKIASVLLTVDRAIQTTETIIAQAKRVKRGLMQKVFRSGLGEHSEWKDTRIGKIPASWSVRKLSEVSNFRNGLNFSADQKGKGTLIVNVPNLYETAVIAPSELDRIEISASEIEKYRLEEGDIIMVRSSVSTEGVGQAALFEGADEPVVFAGFTIRQRPDRNLVSPRYLVQYLRYPKVRKKVASLAGTTALTNLSQKEIGKLDVPIPPIEEQREIANLLTSMDNLTSQYSSQEERLQRLKKGLMQDLLTGRVRTEGKNIDVLDEVQVHG